MFVFLRIFVHTVVLGGACAFTLKIVNTLIKTAHAKIGLRSRHRSNPRPTRFVSGKAGECRRPRRYQVDPWSRGREVARGVQRSSPKPRNRPIFCHRRRIDNFLSPVIYTAAPKCVCIRRLAGARHLSPVVL